MEHLNSNKKIIVFAIFCIIIGIIIGFEAGTYFTLKWVTEKAISFFNNKGIDFNMSAREIINLVQQYKYEIDLQYPTG